MISYVNLAAVSQYLRFLEKLRKSLVSSCCRCYIVGFHILYHAFRGICDPVSQPLKATNKTRPIVLYIFSVTFVDRSLENTKYFELRVSKHSQIQYALNTGLHKSRTTKRFKVCSTIYGSLV